MFAQRAAKKASTARFVREQKIDAAVEAIREQYEGVPLEEVPAEVEKIRAKYNRTR